MNGLVKKWREIPVEIKSSVAYTICNILQNGISLITLPIFTRLLTKEQYGQFTLYSSWQAILIILLTLNLPYGSFLTAMVKYENKREEYIASIQTIMSLLSGGFLVIYLLFAKYFNMLFHLPTAIVVVMLIEILMLAAVNSWSGHKRFEYKYISVIVVTLIVSVVGPLAAYFLVTNMNEKGYARILGFAGVNILVGGFLYIHNYIKGKKLYNKEFCSYALRFNIPLIVYYLSQVVFNQSDRIMIEHFSGLEDAAIYGVAYTLAMVLLFVLNAINNSYVPWMYGCIKNQKPEQNKVVASWISILMAFMLMGVISLAPEIILVLSGKQYAEAVWIVPPVALSVVLLFYAQLFINVLFYYEQKKSLVYASIGAALVNIVLNALLIPVVGYYAAGYTTLFSYIIFAYANYRAMLKLLKEKNLPQNLYNMKHLISIFIVFAVLAFIAMALYNYPIVRCVIDGVVLLGVVLNIKRIKSLVVLVRDTDRRKN
ncbi:MAG: lipopolysaccharide biosynthesis protein [Lachnospiraceae bacterium]